MAGAVFLFFLARFEELAGGEGGEEECEPRVDEEVEVIGAGLPGGAEVVGVLSEKEGEEGEEEARDLEPEDSAGVGDGAYDGLAEVFRSSGESFYR